MYTNFFKAGRKRFNTDEPEILSLLSIIILLQIINVVTIEFRSGKLSTSSLIHYPNMKGFLCINTVSSLYIH